MREPRVSYDEVAAIFDKRYTTGRGEGQDAIPGALRQLLQPGTPNRVLEVGCGTGFWLGSFDNEGGVCGIGSIARHADPREAQAFESGLRDRRTTPVS